MWPRIFHPSERIYCEFVEIISGKYKPGFSCLLKNVYNARTSLLHGVRLCFASFPPSPPLEMSWQFLSALLLTWATTWRGSSTEAMKQTMLVCCGVSIITCMCKDISLGQQNKSKNDSFWPSQWWHRMQRIRSSKRSRQWNAMDNPPFLDVNIRFFNSKAFQLPCYLLKSSYSMSMQHAKMREYFRTWTAKAGLLQQIQAKQGRFGPLYTPYQFPGYPQWRLVKGSSFQICLFILFSVSVKCQVRAVDTQILKCITFVDL